MESEDVEEVRGSILSLEGEEVPEDPRMKNGRAPTDIVDREATLPSQKKSREKTKKLDRDAVAPEPEVDSLVMKLGVDSFHILNTTWVSNIMVALFLLLAIALPYFAWFESLNYFSY